VRVTGGDENRAPGCAQGLDREVGGFARDLVVLEEVASAGDHVDLGLQRSFDDPLQRVTKRFAVLLPARAMEAFAGKGSVEMQVSEMEQAKGHKSPVRTQNLPGA